MHGYTVFPFVLTVFAELLRTNIVGDRSPPTDTPFSFGLSYLIATLKKEKL